MRFDVSRMTIHRDLDDLEAAGLLRKVRGGATIEASAQFESDYRYRERQGAAEKRLIAAHTARLVEPGMSVMVDDSSTAQALVPHLAALRPLTVITNNLSVITGLADRPGIALIALGGTYSQKFNGFFGLMTEEALKGLRADIALVSTSAIHDQAAFHQDQEVVGVKRRMLRSSKRRVLMADHAKFGRTALHFFAELDAFDAVVTGSELPEAARKGLRDARVALKIAETEGMA
jgi:DeoR/GlpR family transcriptional regulator of sugar metabolism